MHPDNKPSAGADRRSIGLNFRDRSINPIVVLVLFLPTLWTPDVTAAQPVSAQANIRAAYAKLPLAFERNAGQMSSEIEYLSRGRDATLLLTGTGAVLQLRRGSSKGAVLRMRLPGANRDLKIAGENRLQGNVNSDRQRSEEMAHGHPDVPAGPL